jgi:hypothetical protein
MSDTVTGNTTAISTKADSSTWTLNISFDGNKATAGAIEALRQSIRQWAATNNVPILLDELKKKS